MTLAALVLHALRSFSLSGEQLFSELVGNPDQDIYRNLRLIVRFTFITEGIFAFFLTWGFYYLHHDFFKALELGIFTSISAFCNAGFFPGAENLVPYVHEKLLLTMIAMEIIIGGMAPAVTFSLLQKCSWRQQPFMVKLVTGSTLILLAAGTVGLLLFEWNGIFGNLPWYDKIVNAFFQSASLRTAGFNSVNFGALGVPAFIVMVILMFIGGSPGGTAGGIKTTVAAVLALTFRAALRRSDAVAADRRRIPDGTVIQAVAILLAALMIFLAVLMMLAVTQESSTGSLVFETVSALGTVGLSLGATGEIDSVGQIILMLAMFTGRLGPLTLFLLLSEKRQGRDPGYPVIKIPLG
jgi:trk system potassium uptake protein TrkH